VFMNTTGGTAVNHVGIAISATSWVQARRPGVGVVVTPLPPDGVILAVRRFVPAG
jgi:cell wall-associated NlpC family hydrolase